MFAWLEAAAVLAVVDLLAAVTELVGLVVLEFDDELPQAASVTVSAFSVCSGSRCAGERPVRRMPKQLGKGASAQ